MSSALDTFKSFILQCESHEYDSHTGSYILQIATGDLTGASVDVVSEKLKEINTSCLVSNRSSYIEMEFIDSEGSWCNGYEDLFYSDGNKFLRRVLDKRDVPRDYVILSDKISSSEGKVTYVDKVEYVVGWLRLLAAMADHEQGSDGTLVFFIHSESERSRVLEFKPHISIKDVKNIDECISRKDFKNLEDSWFLDDALQKDRRSVMLVSFGEIVRSEGYLNCINGFLRVARKFYDRYSENYEIYVNRFSVDKQLREIDEQYLVFVGKLQEFISSSQAKAFAIPGVMIAIGALVRTEKILGVLGIIIGLVMTWILIRRSNAFIRENVNHLGDTVDGALSIYSRSSVEAVEIKSQAEKVKENLKTQFELSNRRLDGIDQMSFYMLIAGLTLALLQLLGLNSWQKLKTSSLAVLDRLYQVLCTYDVIWEVNVWV